MQLECARVLHESLLKHTLMYGSETMVWRRRGLGFGLYSWTTSEICWVSGEWIRELCGMTKGVVERIDEGVFRWFGPLERMDNDSSKRVYAGEWDSSRSVGRPRKK